MLGSWMRVIGYAFGAAAVAGAAQVGVGEAIGILRWSDGGGDPAGWNAQLTWIAFIHAVAVLGGASVGRRALRRPGGGESFGVRLLALLSAAVGTAAAGALSWLPARTLPPPVNANPELVVVMTAGAGIVAGLVIGAFALSLPPVAGGLRATIAWVWAVGIGAGVAGYLTHRPYRAPRLGVLDAPSVVPATVWTGPYLMVGLAVLFALLVGVIARWAGARRFGVALCGLAGPAVVAAAYAIAGPGGGADRSTQFTPYIAAMIAAGAGLLASLLVALPGAGRRRKAPAPAPRTEVYEDLLPQPADAYHEDYSDWLGGEDRVPEPYAAPGYR